MANADVDVYGLTEAVMICKAEDSASAPDYLLKQAEASLKGLLEDRLEDAIAKLDPKNLWVTFLRMHRFMKYCRMVGYQNEIVAFAKAREKMKELELSDDPDLDVIKIPRVAEPSVIQHFQKLFDVCTIDFMQLSKLTVERVIEVQHECTRAEYLLRRSQLVSDCESGEAVKQISVKSQQVDWTQPGIWRGPRKPPEAKYNEFYAFHGTSPSIAEVITDTDFKINSQAVHGFTFGRGVYVSEYVTHAQFFSERVCGGLDGNRCAILVCRVFCGRIQDAGEWPNTAQRHEDAAKFEKNLESGRYHSTMGAEWPPSFTCPQGYKLREFILDNDDQVLPEFIVICSS